MYDTSRRLLLRLGVKLMFLIAIVFSIYVLVAPLADQYQPQDEQPPLLRIRITDLETGNIRRIPWQGGNLILLRYSEAVSNQLNGHNKQLHKPHPVPDPQEIYVAFDRGTGMGCPLQWLPPATLVDNAPLRPWPGGFRDTCDHFWYDAAGRIFAGQAVGRNLESPTYRLTGELLEIGRNSDNPPPVE